MRYEEKYYITPSDHDFLRSVLRSTAAADPNQTSDGGYFIRSLYFDDIYDSSFFDKIDGLENRAKYRLRAYSIGAELLKFEIKNKYNTVISKESAFVTRADAENLIRYGNFEWLLRHGSNVLNKIYCAFRSSHYRPVVMIDYLREAYFFPVNNVRITFDRSLKKHGTDFDMFVKHDDMVPVVKDKIIMEIKYSNEFPRFLRNIMQISSFQKCALSKYCLSRSA